MLAYRDTDERRMCHTVVNQGELLKDGLYICFAAAFWQAHCTVFQHTQALVQDLFEEETGSLLVCPGAERWPVGAAANETERGGVKHSKWRCRNCSQSRDPLKTY